MEKSLSIMENPKFGKVRKIIEPDGTTLYCAADVAKALGYAEPKSAVRQHCRWGVKRTIPHPQSPDKEIEMSFLPKGDVVRLITESHLPAAKEFESWLFDEVAVSVVDTGMYMTPQAIDALLSNPNTMLTVVQNWAADHNALIEARHENETLTAAAEEAAPKLDTYDSFMSADNCMHVGEVAKIIVQNGGKSMGANRLFVLLRAEGYLGSHGAEYNVPTQYAQERGYMRVKYTPVTTGNTTKNKPTPLVTPKGVEHLIKKYGATAPKDLIEIAMQRKNYPTHNGNDSFFGIN
jgi:anti-repressor protein